MIFYPFVGPYLMVHLNGPPQDPFLKYAGFLDLYPSKWT